MVPLPMTRIVLYKHGVGHFEREGIVDGEARLSLTFKQGEVSDVLKSLTVLDLNGGHVASVSYDSMKPLAQLLAEVALTIPDDGSLVGLLPQIKGARVRLHPPGPRGNLGGLGVVPSSSSNSPDSLEGILLGVDHLERQTSEGVSRTVLVSLLTDAGEVRSADLHSLSRLEILDPILRRDLDYALRTLLSAKKKDARTFTFFAQGEGRRTLRLSYTLEAPVWKATYRIILHEDNTLPLLQGWAVVDNTQDEDWEEVKLSLVAGLPVSFVHDLYTPRSIRRPVVEVQETTGVLPPVLEESFMGEELTPSLMPVAASREMPVSPVHMRKMRRGAQITAEALESSTPTQVRERQLGDLFEYEIEHPVTIRRNQSALVPIVLRSFEGKPVLLYNKTARAENPMRCVEMCNTTGLTLEGGPVTVLEGARYVGEAMLETIKPGVTRLVPYAVELSVHVLDNVDSHSERVERVQFRRGQLRVIRAHETKTSYRIKNNSTKEATLVLEHPRQNPEDKLLEPAAADAITENYWRVRWPLPPQQESVFVVRTSRLITQATALTDITSNQVSTWLKQKYIEPATEKILKEAIKARTEIGKLEEKVSTLEKERAKIHAEQERIRGNLTSLGDRSSEKDLRERFVRTLNTQEDRLEAIQREIQALNEQIAVRKEEMNTVLASLEESFSS